MTSLDLAVGADPRWVPLLLDPEGPVDAWAERAADAVLELRLDGPLAGDRSAAEAADERGRVTALLAGLSRRLAGPDVAPELRPAAAWALAPEEVFLPLTVAVLRVQPLGTDDDVDAAVGSLVGTAEQRYGNVDVTGLDTPSGPAFRVSWRPVLDAQDRSLVDEQQAVLWLLPSDGVLVVLSAWWTDLVQAGRWTQALDDLARLVEVRVVA